MGGKKNFVGGSPPRVRGHVKSTRFEVLFLRITPAGAGTCVSTSNLTKSDEDHPRGCGDMQ